MKKYIFALILLFVCGTLCAEESPPYSGMMWDFSLKPTLALQRQFTTIAPESGKTLSFRTVPVPSIGVSIMGYNLGFSFSYPFEMPGYDEKNYGSTGFSDFRFEFLSNRVVFKATLKQYEGYFQPTDDLNVDNYILDEMKGMTIDVGAIYVFNWEQFSLPAALSLSQIQHISAGSFLLGGGFRRLEIEDAGKRDPAWAGSKNHDFVDFNGFAFNDLTVRCGYAHIFVFNGFYVSGLFYGGPSLQFQSLETFDDEESRTFVSIGGEIRLSAGYNSETVFGGIVSKNSLDFSFLEKGTVMMAEIGGELFIGYRF